MLDTTRTDKLYTTGEVASACGVTVRTVQYYDEKGLLHPTERSEGGRRLYDDAALEQMRTICMLKSLGLPLKAIRGVLSSNKRTDVLRHLLEEQTKTLEARVEDDRAMLAAVQRYQAELGLAPTILGEQRGESQAQGAADTGERPSSEDNPSMEHSMSRFFAEKGTRLYQTQRKMLLEGIVVDIVEVACVVGGIMTGNWWPLVAALPLMAIIIAEMVRMYHRDARYVCPHCHTTFQPSMREFFFATHTPKTRKLTCENCGTKDWCVEVAAESAQ